MNRNPLKVQFTPIRISESEAGQRFDIFISASFPSCSRSYAAKLISDGVFRIDGNEKKPGYRLRIGELVSGSLPEPEPLTLIPEAIPLDIIYEDSHIIVINKQPGIVVHPSPGHYTGTLVNALLYHCPDLGGIGGKLRPGIVHRLDKDTSGLLVIAKTSQSQQHLSDQFKGRQIHKRYLALVHGVVREDSGEIHLPIGRHPVDRKKMSTVSHTPREAVTLWTVAERFSDMTLLELTIKTGRTHQIRVHCAAMHHPIIGDPVYGSRRLPSLKPLYIRLRTRISRQMLHACHLALHHPETGQWMAFDAPLPADMEDTLSEIRMMSPCS